MSDRHVPGIKLRDGENVLRFSAPAHWERFTLDIPRVPPSMNDNAIRSNWRGFHTQKKSWQEEIETMLMVCGVRRAGWYEQAIVGCRMRFPRAERRDTPNFSWLVAKACGDAMVTYGALADDDDDHFAWAGVEFEEERGPQRTRLVLFLEPTTKEG